MKQEGSSVNLDVKESVALSSKRTLSVLLLSLILGLASGDRSSVRLIIIRFCF